MCYNNKANFNKFNFYHLFIYKDGLKSTILIHHSTDTFHYN
jgi:hypothetical protein